MTSVVQTRNKRKRSFTSDDKAPSRKKYTKMQVSVIFVLTSFAKIFIVKAFPVGIWCLKFHFDKQIARNLRRKNAYSGLQWSDVACNNNVTLVLLVTSLTL